MIDGSSRIWQLGRATILALLLAGCGASAGLTTGDVAPAFSLPAAGGSTVALADYAGRQPVLLYFHMADG